MSKIINKKSIAIAFLILAIVLILFFSIKPIFKSNSQKNQKTANLSSLTPEEAERRETVIFDIDSGIITDPNNQNPYSGLAVDHGLQIMMEPLFIFNFETNQIMPRLGESMTPNKTLDVWNLTTRKGIKWNDGIDFTADDIVFTTEMLIKNGEKLGMFSDLKDWVQKVEKIDNYNIKFTLKKPNPRFQLDFWTVVSGGPITIVPKHIWENENPPTFKNIDIQNNKWPVFTGPYKMTSINDNEAVYMRDDNWWGAKTGLMPLPKPKKLIWRVFDTSDKKVEAMANHQLDSMMDIPLSNLINLKKRDPNAITWFNNLPYAWIPDPCSRTLEFNDSKTPWNDKDMRWAINYVINRNEIIAFAYEGTTFASRFFFPAYKPLNRLVDLLEEQGIYKKYPLLEYNPERAKNILLSKGWHLNKNGFYEKNGKVLSLDIATNESFIEKQRIAKIIVDELRAFGINATTHDENGEIWYDNFQIGNFQSRIGWQTCGSVNDPWPSLDTFNTRWLKPNGIKTGITENAWRWSGTAANKYSSIVDKIGLLPLNSLEIDKLFVDAATIWLNELPVIPIAQARKIVPFDTTYWKGWPTSENSYIQPPTWQLSAQIILEKLEPSISNE